MKNAVWMFALVALLACSQAGDHETPMSASTDSPKTKESVESNQSVDTGMDPQTLDSTLESFNSDFQKVAFLRKMLLEDQRVTTVLSEATQDFGYDSPESKEASENMLAVHRLNVQKLDAFTDKFGGPQQNSVGRMQADAMWYAVHHSEGVDVRARYFEIMKQTYKYELISGGQYTQYLNQWYELVNGERLFIEGTYTEEQEIAKLYDLLGVTN